MADTPLKVSLPRVPAGVGRRGKRLWKAVTAAFDLSCTELEMLELAARALDRIVALETALEGAPLTIAGSKGQQIAHPSRVELRAEVLLVSRLLAQLDVPQDAAGAGKWDGLSASSRARKAAGYRWQHRGG